MRALGVVDDEVRRLVAVRGVEVHELRDALEASRKQVNAQGTAMVLEIGQQKDVLQFRFHDSKSSERAWQSLLSSMCIGYQFSRVRTCGTWRSGLVTQRTRVAQPTSGAKHLVG